MHNWHVLKNFDEASLSAAQFIASHILQCLQNKSTCNIALPGGNTPAKCLSLLAQEDLPWEQIHWYLGDERCLPPGDSERNDVMLDKNLWSILPVANMHTIPAELGPEEAAKLYRESISDIEYFDIVFLGMGEDGHTASLFPGNLALNDKRSAVPVYNSPKAPAERVSLSLSTLEQAKIKLVLACGEAKREMIDKIKSGESLPVNSIGSIDWFVDELAVNDC